MTPLVALSTCDTGGVFDGVWRMHQHRSAEVDAGEHFGKAAVGMADVDIGEHGAAATEDEGFPGIAFSEQGTGRHRENVIAVPDGDADLDPEAVAEGFGGWRRVEQVAEDDDALFLDTESGDFGKGGGFDAPDPGFERRLAAPLLNIRVIAFYPFRIILLPGFRKSNAYSNFLRHGL